MASSFKNYSSKTRPSRVRTGAAFRGYYHLDYWDILLEIEPTLVLGMILYMGNIAAMAVYTPP